MKTLEEKEKIKAVILYLLNKFTDGLHRVSFYKLLYFSQQYELVHTGKTLLPDKFLALGKGPVPSFVQSLVFAKENHNISEDLEDIMRNVEIAASGDLKATAEPDMSCLAKIDVQAIDTIVENLGDLSPEELVELSHKELCYKNAMRRVQKDPENNILTRIAIAKSGHASPEMLDYIKGIEVRNRMLQA